MRRFHHSEYIKMLKEKQRANIPALLKSSPFVHWYLLWIYFSLQGRHNECCRISNLRRLDCSLNRLFRRWPKKTLKVLAVNSHKWPVTRKCFRLMTSSCRNEFVRRICNSWMPVTLWVLWVILYIPQAEYFNKWISNHMAFHSWHKAVGMTSKCNSPHNHVIGGVTCKTLPLPK